MTELFLSNAALAGVGVALLLFAARTASRDPILRRDLGGAIYLLVTAALLRAAAWGLGDRLPGEARKILHVAWMLALAFGFIRAGVSAALWLYRRFRKTPAPKILRDVIDFSLYLTAAVPILRSQLQVDLTGLLATSAILSLVLGLALQETLGNLFAGLSLQLERPFQVGDLVSVGEHTGRIVQLAWRATRIETARRELITVPNNVMAKQAVVNLSRGAGPLALELYVGASYRAPPDRVRQAVLEALRQVAQVLAEPAPLCRPWAFDDSAIRYQIRCFAADHLSGEAARGEIHSRLWYRFHREGIEIPFPQLALHLSAGENPEESRAARRELIEAVSLFSALSAQERDRLAGELRLLRFGAGERVIREGEAGESFYVLGSGQVSVRAGPSETEVALLARGDHFGEMSLLTGERRSATVVALGDAELYELDRPAFARLFAENPGLAKAFSALLAQRRSELREAAQAAGSGGEASPEASRIFERLRQIFGLRG